jgi:hypothetical protein
MTISKEMSVTLKRQQKPWCVIVGFWIAFVVCLLLFRCPVQAQSSEEEWRAFRKAFPYHIQTIAVSRPYSNGMRTLIISEPPPHVSLNKVKQLKPGWIRSLRVMKYTIGYEGFVKDIVAIIPANESQLSQGISKLSSYLFHTTYKSHALQLPYRRNSKSGNIDLSVTAEEVDAWLFDSKARYLSVFGGPELPIAEILNSTRTHVYLSKEPGLVLWWIPKDTKLGHHRGVIRQFAIDSDLIVGAKIFNNGFLIVARERTAPLDILPPLRTETIALLASVQQQELAQSYERNHILAGRYADKRDWAPIYLSPELRNTEYGSLLNIADQLLKGWTNCGFTKYENFRYPKPPEWPFPKPLHLELGVDELTYNWNTTGVGYTISSDSDETYALNRTGALPVSYIPGGDRVALENPDSPEIQKCRKAEETAYRYFAELKDPHLVRVVQYAALYQIFQRVPFSLADPQVPDPQAEKHLETLIRKLLEKIRDANDKKLFEFAVQISKNLRERGLELSQNKLRSFVYDQFKILRAVLQELPSEKLNLFINNLQLAVLSIKKKPKNDSNLNAKIITFLKSVRFLLPPFAALQKFHQEYAHHSISANKSGWIRTPVVVLSSVYGPVKEYTGGHNLNSKISPFRIDMSVPRGKPQIRSINGNPVIFVNPSDSSKISSIVRTTGKNLQSPKYLESVLTKIFPGIKPRPIRPIRKALSLKPRSAVDGLKSYRGMELTPEATGGFRAYSSGWSVSRQILPSQAKINFRAALKFNKRSIMVHRQSDGTFLIQHYRDGSPIKAFTREDVIDVVVKRMFTDPGQSQSVQLHLSGYSVQEANSFAHTMRVRASSLNRSIIMESRHISKAESYEAFSKNVARNYDFTKASIKSNLYSNGKGLNVTINVPTYPGRSITKAGKIRVKIESIRQISRNALAQLKLKTENLIRRILRLGKTQGMEGLQILEDINRELRILMREVGTKDIKFRNLKIKLETEMGDFYIVQNKPKYNYRTSQTA